MELLGLAVVAIVVAIIVVFAIGSRWKDYPEDELKVSEKLEEDKVTTVLKKETKKAEEKQEEKKVDDKTPVLNKVEELKVGDKTTILKAEVKKADDKGEKGPEEEHMVENMRGGMTPSQHVDKKVAQELGYVPYFKTHHEDKKEDKKEDKDKPGRVGT